MATRSRLAAGVAALAVTALGLAGCGPVTSRQTVTVLGTWTGQEEEQFQQVLAPFEARTGIDVRFEGTRDFEAVLNGRIQSGDAPDLEGPAHLVKGVAVKPHQTAGLRDIVELLGQSEQRQLPLDTLRRRGGHLNPPVRFGVVVTRI